MAHNTAPLVAFPYSPLEEAPTFVEMKGGYGSLPTGPLVQQPPFFVDANHPTYQIVTPLVMPSRLTPDGSSIQTPDTVQVVYAVGGNTGTDGSGPLPLLNPTTPASTSQMTEEERLNTRRRCVRCHQYYSLGDKDLTCFYHPGQFVEPKSCMQGTMVGWTCCRYGDEFNFFVDHPMAKIKVLKADATDRNCRGCRVADTHLEDTAYTNIMSSFPFDSQGAIMQRAQEQAASTKTATPTSPTTPSLIPPPPTTTDEYIAHTVLPSDTLEGLAVRYSVTAGAIQRANRLPNRDIFHLKTLMIPRNGNGPVPPPRAPVLIEDPRIAQRKRFMLQFAVTQQEATYYLEMTEYNFDKAAEEFKADVKWEASNPKKNKNKF
ncbi:hypothetical protein Pelo_13656 [Pelomyxa schiedti]|nr:hypothetical protein Pelo_13656 [Pelomyxa schiedti]